MRAFTRIPLSRNRQSESDLECSVLNRSQNGDIAKWRACGEEPDTDAAALNIETKDGSAATQMTGVLLWSRHSTTAFDYSNGY